MTHPDNPVDEEIEDSVPEEKEMTEEEFPQKPEIVDDDKVEG